MMSTGTAWDPVRTYCYSGAPLTVWAISAGQQLRQQLPCQWGWPTRLRRLLLLLLLRGWRCLPGLLLLEACCRRRMLAVLLRLLVGCLQRLAFQRGDAVQQVIVHVCGGKCALTPATCILHTSARSAARNRRPSNATGCQAQNVKPTCAPTHNTPRHRSRQHPPDANKAPPSVWPLSGAPPSTPSVRSSPSCSACGVLSAGAAAVTGMGTEASPSAWGERCSGSWGAWPGRAAAGCNGTRWACCSCTCCCCGPCCTPPAEASCSAARAPARKLAGCCCRWCCASGTGPPAPSCGGSTGLNGGGAPACTCGAAEAGAPRCGWLVRSRVSAVAAGGAALACPAGGPAVCCGCTALAAAAAAAGSGAGAARSEPSPLRAFSAERRSACRSKASPPPFSCCCCCACGCWSAAAASPSSSGVSGTCGCRERRHRMVIR